MIRTAEERFGALDAFEVDIVARAVASAERLRLVRVARVVTRLGNGWLYPLLSIVIAIALESPRDFLIAAMVSLAIAFIVYPAMKRSLARLRPCDYDASLVSQVQPLDHYSCPSGHAMTAAAYGVPLIFACPAAAPFVIALCALIGWSRVAMGHHYVSDVLIGTVIGATIASGVGALIC